MNSYLMLATKVLSEAHQPLSAKQILKAAYRWQLVPPDLYGKTQHKTLQARLAEDILQRRDKSDFVRTAPGRFFLRRLLNDSSIPARHRREFLAPLRADQLRRFHVLCISRDDVFRIQRRDGRFPRFPEISKCGLQYRRLSMVKGDESICYLRIFVLLCRDGQILLHRSPTSFGDPLDGQVSFGLVGFIKREDQSLFSTDPFGVAEAATRTIFEQLRLPVRVLARLHPALDTEALSCVIGSEEDQTSGVIVVAFPFVVPASPEIDESIALSDKFSWHDRPARINNMAQLDNWSRNLLESGQLDAMLL
jgi:HB1/ASXL restriction endonuclease-like protein with HTH domain